MGSFVFKNLSVKLLPTDGEGAAFDRECGTCDVCTNCTGTITCGDCTNNITCGACTDCTNSCTNCTDCTKSCTNCTDAQTCGTCTNCTSCTKCTVGPTPVDTCTLCTGSGCTCAAHTDVAMFSGPEFDFKHRGDLRSELAAHKERLQAAIAQVEDQERKLEAAGKPQTIEEIDQLKAHLEEAIGELEEQRAKMQAEPAKAEPDEEPGPE